MTTWELARLLLDQPETNVMVSIDDWVYPPEAVTVLDEMYTRQGTAIISVGKGEIIE